MDLFARFLFSFDCGKDSRIKPRAFKPRDGGVSMLYEEGLLREEIIAIGHDCIASPLNNSRTQREEKAATLFGWGSLESSEIMQVGLSLNQEDVQCFPPGHHWNILEWPDDEETRFDLQKRLAEFASERFSEI